MVKSGVGSLRWVIVAALVVGCGEERGDEAAADAGADADACPEQRPNDAGVLLTTRRCPISIEYSIR
jgi:hypothetical protein